jgi:transcriptional regulator with XRE-family HTH domain
MAIVGRQIAAARELLKITQAQLAEAAGVSEQTVKNFEVGRHYPRPSRLKAIVEEIERRGVVFTNGNEPGVKLRSSPPAHPEPPENVR